MKTKTSTLKTGRSSSNSKVKSAGTMKPAKKTNIKSEKKEETSDISINLYERIREKAWEVYLWRIETGEPGSETDDWLTAENIVLNETM